jgi:hypothetical protein
MPAFTPAFVLDDTGEDKLEPLPQYRRQAMSKSDEGDQHRTPRDLDRDTGDRVEKKPKPPESPQQKHDDESQG